MDYEKEPKYGLALLVITSLVIIAAALAMLANQP